MAIAAMGERYGDRLVSQLAQAGGMIENGLKQVTTMKELQSLGQNLSQISPESPDYQQQLMQLGAAHPFAMQDPRGQALVSMGNQQHLQWQHQQYAMQAADRADERATRHDDMAYRRAVAVAGMKGKQDAVRVPFNTGEGQFNEFSAMPQAGFSGSAAINNTTGQPGVVLDAKLGDAIPEKEEPGYEAPPPPANFSGSAAASNSSDTSPDLRTLHNNNRSIAAQAFRDKEGNVDPKMLAQIEATALSLTNGQLSRIAKTATGSGFGYKSRDEAISDFGGKPIGKGLYETDDGTVLTVTQSASGKWHWKTPPADHSALPEFDKNGNARLGNTILQKGNDGTIRKVGTIPQSKPMAEGTLSELQQSSLRSAVSSRDKSEAAYSNFKGEYDAAIAREDKDKDVAAALAKMNNANDAYRSASAKHDALVKSFNSSSSSSAPKKLTSEVKDRLLKSANGDIKKAAEMARKQGYIP